MATLDGVLKNMSNPRQFTDSDQALKYIDSKKGWHQHREVEYKSGDEKTKLTHIRLSRQGFRPIDVVVLEVTPIEEKKEDVAA